MGKAYECDTCKRLFKGNVKNKISIASAEKIEHATVKSYELCDKCFSKVARLFGIKSDIITKMANPGA
jgi:hypothetical protein